MANSSVGTGVDLAAIRRERYMQWMASHDRMSDSKGPPGRQWGTSPKRRAPYYQRNPMWRLHPNLDS